MVFQGPFKFEASLARSPSINDHHSIAQGSQRVQPQVLDAFEGVVHQLHLHKEGGRVSELPSCATGGSELDSSHSSELSEPWKSNHML